MDPELPCLLICPPGRAEVSGVLLPADEDRDALLRVFLFVWTSATFVGVVGRALRAAAAAAALSEAVLDSRRVKAEMAAVAALGFAVEALRGGLGGRRRLDPNMASRCFATGYNRALYGIVLSHAPISLARIERASQHRTNNWS